MQQLKWPIEYLFVGAKVQNYFSPSDPALMRQNLDCWYKYSKYTDRAYYTDGYRVDASSLLATPALVTDTLGVSTAGIITSNVLVVAANTALPVGSKIVIDGHEFYTTAAVAAAGNLVGVQLSPAIPVAIAATAGKLLAARVLNPQGLEVDTKRWAPTIETINISAHGIDIYKQFPASFFNSYTTYHYGGPNINAPKDVGSLFIPFCLYPGTYQPSGHINVSRAREFYMTYNATTFDPTALNPLTGLLVVIASAINFLLISDTKKFVAGTVKAVSSHTNSQMFDGETYKLRETPQCIEYQVCTAMYKWRLGNQAGTVKSSIYGQSAAKALNCALSKSVFKRQVQRLNVSWWCNSENYCAA